MRILKLSILVAACGLSACATVDFAEMAPQATMAVQPASKTVVRKAADNLVDDFSASGWSVRPEQNRIQKTAGFLLKGMASADKREDASYSAGVESFAALKADIIAATVKVDQTVKAADVFLSMATPDEKLRRELKSLEKALMATRQAEISFEKAIERFGAGSDQSEMKAYYKSVGELTRTTNAYGVWVRDGMSVPVNGEAS